MLVIGVIAGWTLCFISFLSGFYFSQWSASRMAGEPHPDLPIWKPKPKTPKRKPVSVSEQEQAHRESLKAPLDPTHAAP